MVYSASTAERFSLPKGGIEALDPGVNAIVLRVVQRTPADAPVCNLDFYLDDSLDIAYPIGTEGVMNHPDDENPFFFASGDLGPEARRWSAMLGNYHATSCLEKPKSCMSQGSGPSAFVRHLIPGLALQTYVVICDALDAENGPTEMWILREGRDTKDVQDLRGDPSATFRFKVPFSLIQHSAPRIREAVRFYETDTSGPEPARGRFTVPR